MGFLNQTSLTFSLSSVCEWGDFFGLEATVLNLRTNILKHGKNNKYPTPRIKGAATSHPNNCKHWLKENRVHYFESATDQNDNVRTNILVLELKRLRISTTTTGIIEAWVSTKIWLWNNNNNNNFLNKNLVGDIVLLVRKGRVRK